MLPHRDLKSTVAYNHLPQCQSIPDSITTIIIVEVDIHVTFIKKLVYQSGPCFKVLICVVSGCFFAAGVHADVGKIRSGFEMNR